MDRNKMDIQILDLAFKGYAIKFDQKGGFIIISHPHREVHVEDILRDAPESQNLPKGYIYNTINGTVTIG